MIGCLVMMSVCYAAATLPRLGDYPLPDWAEMGIAAPAYKLAKTGVYGNDLFTGFHRAETRNYEYMPAYPMLVALSFEWFGLGVIQARAVSLLCGLATVLLTFHLGRQLFDPLVGLVAAGALLGVRLGLVPLTTGVPLLDLARVIKYDILVPVLVLACSSVFVLGCRRLGEKRPWSRGLLLVSGVLAGAATLAHLYGAFIVPALLVVLTWQLGGRIWRQGAPWLIIGGWLLGISPWLLYVAQDLPAYLGQMSRHEGRFAVFDPRFYWDNLMREYWRYGSWSGGSLRAAFLQPRIGIWLFLIGVPLGLAQAWRRARGMGELGSRLLVVALPLLAVQLGLLVHVKRHAYVLLVLPFIALAIAVAAVSLWRRQGARARVLRGALVGIAVLAMIESGNAVATQVREVSRVTRYRELGERLRRVIPEASRVLISQTYWLALADYETRSVNLVLQLSVDRSIGRAMEEIGAEYVVIESYFLDPASTDRRAIASDSRSFPWFQRFAAHLREHCSTEVLRVDDPHYGELMVYRCARAPAEEGA